MTLACPPARIGGMDIPTIPLRVALSALAACWYERARFKAEKARLKSVRATKAGEPDPREKLVGTPEDEHLRKRARAILDMRDEIEGAGPPVSAALVGLAVARALNDFTSTPALRAEIQAAPPELADMLRRLVEIGALPRT